MDRLLHVCPAAVIASASGATITLATTGPEVSGASPTDDFYAGAAVLLVDRSTPANSAIFGVLSITSGTVLVLTPTPGFTIQNNVDYIVLDPAGSFSGTTASGYQLIEFSKLADVDGTAGVSASTDNEPRWR